MQSDSQLVVDLREGDAQAGAALVDRYYGSILRFFRNKLPSEVHDLTQQTFLECFAALPRLREPARFRSFLFGVACNQLRKRLRARSVDGARLDFGTASAADLDPSPSAIIARRQEHQRLLEALRRVPVDAQLVLELHYWEDLRVEEIAEILEIPVGTAKSRLRRARQQLAQILLGAPPDEQQEPPQLEGWVRDLREIAAYAK